MANQKLQRLIVLSRVACLALTIVAVALVISIPTKHMVRASQNASSLMALALIMQTVGPSFYLCLIYARRMGPQENPPENVSIVVLAVVEWVLACFAYGTACACLAVAHTIIRRRVCVPTACAMYLSVAMIACIVGLLGWFSAIGTLWLMPPRFRQ